MGVLYLTRNCVRCYTSYQNGELSEQTTWKKMSVTARKAVASLRKESLLTLKTINHKQDYELFSNLVR